MKMRCMVAFLLLSCCQAAAADDFVVIANYRNPVTLTREQVADIFLGRSLQKDAPEAFDCADCAIKARFYAEVAGMSETRVRAFWAKKVFTGRGRPPQLLQMSEMQKFLASRKAALTYVRAEAVPDGAVVVYRSPPRQAGEQP